MNAEIVNLQEFKLRREPVRDVADLATLSEEEILEGYRAGLDGWPEPGSNRSRAYWHGWRNGAADAGRIEHDDAMRQLAYDYVHRPDAPIILKGVDHG